MKTFSIIAIAIAAFSASAFSQSAPTPTPTYRPLATPPVYQPKTVATPTPGQANIGSTKELVDRGVMLFEKKEYEGAVKLFNQAVKIDPEYVDAYRFRARTALSIYEQNPTREGTARYTALFNFDHAIRRGSMYPDDFYLRGRTQEYLEKKTEAIADYRKALSIDAHFQKAKDALAKLGAAATRTQNSIDTLLGLWEGTATSGTSFDKTSFQFSRVNGELDAKWSLNNSTLRVSPADISVTPNGTVIIKSTGNGASVRFVGEIDHTANKIEGTVIITVGSERKPGTWSVTRTAPAAGTSPTSTPSTDESRFKRIILDIAMGKAVPPDDIAWANRYEQQKKAAGKAPTGTSPAPAAKVSLFDTFDNDKNGWPIADNSSLKTSIAGSRYVLQTKFDSILIATIPTDKVPKLDPNRDFSIEVSFAFTSGKPTDSFGLVWGVSNDRKRRHSYGVLQNGNYYVGKHEGGKWVDEIKVSETNLVKKGPNVMNRLIVRKRGNQLDLYIDTIRVTTIPYVAFEPNGSFGFQINGESSVSVDYIFVQQD